MSTGLEIFTRLCRLAVRLEHLQACFPEASDGWTALTECVQDVDQLTACLVLSDGFVEEDEG